jgi:hypothetical protein
MSEPSLDAKIAAAFANGKVASSNDLQALIQEVEAGIAEADTLASAERDKSLDFSIAPAEAEAAAQRVVIAELKAQRYRAALARLRDQSRQALAAENQARYLDRHHELEREGEALAQELAEVYLGAVDRIVGIFVRLRDFHGQCHALHVTDPGGLPHVDDPELQARGLSAFSRECPSLLTAVQLIDWTTGKPIWPLTQPNELAVAYAMTMRPLHDIRYTSQWWRAAEQDRIERAAITERRIAEQQAAEVASRQRYEASLQQAEKEREQRAHERRRA